jgi:hypothetical protein
MTQGQNLNGALTELLVTPVARLPEHLDLFKIGSGNGVYSTCWDVQANSG